MVTFIQQFRTGAILSVLAPFILAGCVRDNADPGSNPTIEFISGEGYTTMDDTVGTQDTLLVGVVIAKGSDYMDHFKVTVGYDTDPALVTDSLPVGSDSFEFEKTIVTREVPGTEKWSFLVVEDDGDLIRRSITFTVE